MFGKRIIPCLDIKDGNLVKGINFVDLVYIGDPIEYARMYENQGADEIVLLDIEASTKGTISIKDIIRRISNDVKVPIVVGGGIRTIEDVKEILNCGASKISINSAAVQNPELIKKIADEFGSQSIVVAIDGKRDKNGEFKVYVKGGMENTGIDLIKWSKQCEMLGAGEILLTSIDADGTKLGYDTEMTKAIVDNVSIPVIASGGCGSIGDIVNVFEETACDAALVASLVHYKETTIEEIKKEIEGR